MIIKYLHNKMGKIKSKISLVFSAHFSSELIKYIDYKNHFCNCCRHHVLSMAEFVKKLSSKALPNLRNSTIYKRLLLIQEREKYQLPGLLKGQGNLEPKLSKTLS